MNCLVLHNVAVSSRNKEMHTLLQGRDREAMLQLSDWHRSSSASTQKEPQKTEKPCVPGDNVILSYTAGNIKKQDNIWRENSRLHITCLLTLRRM